MPHRFGHGGGGTAKAAAQVNIIVCINAYRQSFMVVLGVSLHRGPKALARVTCRSLSPGVMR